MKSRSHGTRIQIGMGIALSIFLAASMAHAQTRVETLEWDFSAPELLAGFDVVYGTSSGNLTESVNVGVPPNPNGPYTYNLTVDEAATVYVAIRARAIDGRTSLSNERVRGPASQAPPPEPDPAPAPPPSDDTGGATAGTPAAFSPAGDVVFDFENSPVRNSVAGWVDTKKDSSMEIDDSLFRVLDLNGNRVLGTSSTATNIHSHYISSASPSWSSYEVRGAMMMADRLGGVGVTAHSRFPAADQYYRLRAFNGNSFELSAHGNVSTCANKNTGVVPKAGVWFRFSLKVTSSATGNRVTARVWEEGTAEPTNPQADCTDSTGSRPTAGTVGVWSMGAGSKYWDALDITGVSSTNVVVPLEPPVLIDVQPVSP